MDATSFLCRHQGAEATAEVVKMLLNVSSEALTSQTDRGVAPLHLACGQDASMPLIKSLLEDPALVQRLITFRTTLAGRLFTFFVFLSRG
jgi:hypothetical protein